MKSSICAFLVLLLLGVMHPVFAKIKITNLSDSIQTFQIDGIGNDIQIIAIPSGDAWVSYSPRLTITPIDENGAGESLMSHENDRFVYWPDGTFAIQRRGISSRGPR